MRYVEKRTGIRVAAALICAGLLVASGFAQSKPTRPDTQLYQRAYQLVIEEDYGKAEELFKQFLDQYRRSSWRDDSAFWLCYIQAKKQPDSEVAFRCYEDFLKSYPRSKFRNNVEAEMALIASRLVEQGNSAYQEKLARLKEGQDEELTLMVLSALADDGEVSSLEEIKSLYERTQSERIRQRIASLLDEFDLPEAEQYLMRIVEGQDSVKTRALAVRSLGERAGRKSVSDFLKKIVLSDEDKEIRKQALRALAEGGSDVGYFVDIALGDDENMALTAIRAMPKGGSGFQTYRRIYQEARLPKARLLALRRIGDGSSSEAIGFLKETAIGSENGDARTVATRALGEMRAPEAYQALVELSTGSKDPSVRSRAVREIADRGKAEAVPAIRSVAESDSSPSVRSSAVRALGSTKSNDALPFLVKAARDDVHVDVRRSAVRAIRSIGTPEAKQALIDLLKSNG